MYICKDIWQLSVFLASCLNSMTFPPSSLWNRTPNHSFQVVVLFQGIGRIYIYLKGTRKRKKISHRRPAAKPKLFRCRPLHQLFPQSVGIQVRPPHVAILGLGTVEESTNLEFHTSSYTPLWSRLTCSINEGICNKLHHRLAKLQRILVFMRLTISMFL